MRLSVLTIETFVQSVTVCEIFTLEMCMDRNVHGPKCAWAEMCMDRNVHGPKCAWIEMCMDRNVHGPKCAWTEMCMDRNVHELDRDL